MPFWPYAWGFFVGFVTGVGLTLWMVSAALKNHARKMAKQNAVVG